MRSLGPPRDYSAGSFNKFQRAGERHVFIPCVTLNWKVWEGAGRFARQASPWPYPSLVPAPNLSPPSFRRKAQRGRTGRRTSGLARPARCTTSSLSFLPHTSKFADCHGMASLRTHPDPSPLCMVAISSFGVPRPYRAPGMDLPLSASTCSDHAELAALKSVKR